MARSRKDAIDITRLFLHKTQMHSAAAALPFLTLLLATRGLAPRTGSLRAAFVWALVLFGVVVLVATEILSRFSWLNAPVLTALWLGLCVLCALWCLRIALIEDTPPIAWPRRPERRSFMLLAAALGVGLGLTLAVALIYPPNSLDALNTHMPRVAHWLEARSIRHYATPIDRQLWSSPLADYAVLHFQALNQGSDGLVNMVPWLFGAGALVVVSLIARELGGGGRQQILASVLALMAPAFAMRMTATGTDAMLSFWLVCLLWFHLRHLKDKRSIDFLGLALSIAFAIATKASAVIVAAPLLAWIFLGWLRAGPAQALVRSAALVLCVVLINAPHVERNYTTFGAGQGHAPIHVDMSPPIVLAGLTESVAAHVAWPIRYPFDEDQQGNPLHLVLLAASLAGLASSGVRRRMGSQTAIGLVCVAAGFALVSVLMKGQSADLIRAQIPIFVLGAALLPKAGEAMRVRIGRSQPSGALASILCIMVVAQGLAAASLIRQRPLFDVAGGGLAPSPLLAAGREDKYFAVLPALRRSELVPLLRIVDRTTCTRLGLKLNREGWEYPLWAIRQNRQLAVRFTHVGVSNESRIHASAAEEEAVCAILVLDDPTWTPAAAAMPGFDRIADAGPLMQLYLKPSAQP